MRRNLLFLFILLLAGCDEFALKKTATIRKVSGTIRFDPSSPQLFLSLVYDMMNYREKTLREVYFYCHEAVTIDAIYDGNTPLRMEQGVGIGMSIKVYRVRVADWLPGTRRLFRMEARITGQEKSSGFFLSREGVFLESSRVWIPVSFDEIPAFSYSLSVEVPLGYQAILGASLVEEKTSSQTVLSRWESESTNLLFTGRLVIGRFQKIEEGGVAFYLPERYEAIPEKRLSTLFSLLRDGKDILQRYVGSYPFRDVRIVFVPREVASLEEWTDGLFSANMLLLEESLVSALTNQKRFLLDGVLLGEDNWLYVLKVILHEMSHAYIGYGLRWEKEDLLSLESLTEVTGLKLLEWLSPEAYRLAINRLQYDWQVVSLFGESRLKTYLYRNLLLSSTLTPRQYLRLLRGLRGRYLYTLIDENSLLQTLADQGETNTLSSLVSLWNTPPRWQMGLSLTNGGVVVFSSAPPHPMTLVVETPSFSTNLSIEVSGSLFVPLPWKRTTTLSLMSDIQWADETIGDDILSDSWKIILSNLTLYYRGETNVAFLLSESSQDKKLRLPREDRFLSLVVMPSLEVVYHRHERKDNILYLYAYKKGSNTRSTYGLFVFREENNRWLWEGVYDPSLDYQVSF
ncbi:hypothetical protein BREVNS_1248 [Brevinematales bacterium NS]|nr:hypothetical protein BREVNS_1248 [Brevinematales bacterium NS]